MLLSRIVVYPVKSLDGVSVTESRITSGGILEHDRIYAIFDESGKYVNGKRTPKIQLVRSEFDPTFQEIALGLTGSEARQYFKLHEPAPINRWLSDYFGFAAELKTEAKSGFPDDTGAPGPTICSEASLEQITTWYPDQMTLESAQRRFRTNLELGDALPFEEDRLFGLPDEKKPFLVGNVRFLGHNPCQRCVVPTRDPDSSDPIPNFQKKFMEMRQKTLPEWSQPLRFNHYYRFAVNTSIPGTEADKILRVGDLVHID